MTGQTHRLPTGGRIDRERKLRFTFDGEWYEGHPGDTLASALLANGVRTIGRSFKYHRPRGVYSIGAEEPNALVELRDGARREPNTRATQIELFDGLAARSQHAWPSRNIDIGALNQAIARFIPAGFYYKTFMWPAKAWRLYEFFIRRAAGMGRAAEEADPDHYQKMSAHCDVLVVGAGPAGLMAARAAAASGGRVILVDERDAPGGWLRYDREEVDGQPAMAWVDGCLAELEALPEVRVLARTTAFGYYDHNTVAAVERVQDHIAVPDPDLPRQRLWTIRARRVVLATGAIEQPMAFADNDRPGVMLAGAARGYVNAYGVAPGRRAVIQTNNDSGYRTALDLAEAGIEIAAVLDTRQDPRGELIDRVHGRGIPLRRGTGVVGIRGGGKLWRAEAMALDGVDVTPIDCDLVCVSGGWAPAVHLFSQSGGRIVYDDARACFVPGESKQAVEVVGAANGVFDLPDILAGGARAGEAAARAAGMTVRSAPTPRSVSVETAPAEARWVIPDAPGRHRKRFVDLQDDVTVDDVHLAEREGFRSVEHLKRYTTLGMGTDQGKTSNLVGLSIMAKLRGETIQRTGTTTFRPPYTPVAIGALAGQEVGAHFQPTRRTPMHDWHAANGVVWQAAGLWQRPHYYPRGKETIDDASYREVTATRNSVGVADVTTLGKIDIQGPDAGEFLNRVYANGFAKLPVGKARYGLMLREDGIVWDDGTTSRLAEHHYLMTTTTANAGPVLAKLEFYLQTVWPGLRVHVASVTDQWAGIAVAGPNSRRLLEKLVDIDISNEAFPFMAAGACRLGGIPARLFRISFSGELAYEVNVPSDWGEAAWEMVMQAGREWGVTAYGLEAMGTMRIEKGHVAGSEINGQTTADDLGLGRMLSGRKEFVGKGLAFREGLIEGLREELVGLVPVDGRTWIRAGAQLIEHPDAPRPVRMLGHVTAIAYSPELGTPIALGLLSGGLGREGETLYAAHALKNEYTEVRVVKPHFVDPKGERMHA